MTGLTPSQTVGPFLAIGLSWPDGPYVVDESDPAAVVVEGVVTDGNGDPVTDALVETWQADSDGYFNHPDDPREKATDFRGFGRCPTGPDGSYRIVTRKPGPVPAADGALQAPHIDVSLFARGLLNRVVTRIYFGDEDAANAVDPVLSTVSPERRATLVASPVGEGRYRFDVRLQGSDETVFFAI